MTPENRHGTDVENNLHSGKLPREKGGELPLPHLEDPTPLEEVAKQYPVDSEGNIIVPVPDTAEGLSDDNKTDEQLLAEEQAALAAKYASPEKHSNRNKILAFGAGGLVAALVTAGAFFALKPKDDSNNANKPPQPDPKGTNLPSTPKVHKSATPKVTQAPTPTPEVTPPATETMPSELSAFEAENPQQFNVEPKPSQLKWLSWQNRDIEEYANQYATLTGNSNEKYPDTVSINNSPQEILTISAMSIQHAFMLSTADEAKKAVIASLHMGAMSPAYPIWEAQIDKEGLNYTPLDAKFFAVTGQIAISTAISASPLETDASGEKYEDITFSYTDTTNGVSTEETATNRFYYEEFPGYNGATQSTWLQK